MIYSITRCKQFVCMGLSQKLPVNGFKWVESLSEIDKDFIKTMMKMEILAIFLK